MRALARSLFEPGSPRLADFAQARLGRRRRRAPARRRGRRRADAGARRRRPADHRDAAQEHGRRRPRARAGASEHAARRADRRHRDGQVVLPRALRRARRADDRRRPAGARTPSRPARPASRRRRALRRRRSCGRTARSTGRRSAASSSPIAPPAPTSRRSSTPRSTGASASGSPTCPAGTRVAIADIPLLFETGHEHDFDRVIVVRLRARRAAAPADGPRRPDRAGARARLAAQWPIDEKVARADYVIRTDGTFAETDLDVGRAFDVRSRLRAGSSRRLVQRRRRLSSARAVSCSVVLRRRDPLLDERVPLVAVRALPEQLGAAVAAADADVRIEVEDRVARQLDVAGDERRRQIAAATASARSPGASASACGLCTSASNSSSSASRADVAGDEVARQREPRPPVLRAGGDQPAAQRREALRRRRACG